VTHVPVATLAQVGAKTGETRHFKPLPAPPDLAGAVVAFDAPHSVRANITWLVEAKKAHYIAVIKTNQPAAYARLAALPWNQVPVAHSRSETGHRRRESRSIKTLAVADSLGGIAFPHARLALRVHRRRKETGERESRESVYAVTSLDVHQAGPADLSAAVRGHWGIENSSHRIRDVTFAEDASTVHAGSAPRAMAAFRNLAIGALKILGADNIAKATRAIRHQPEQVHRALKDSRPRDEPSERPTQIPGWAVFHMPSAKSSSRITRRFRTSSGMCSSPTCSPFS
ncbi:ISAs1 family transposase, partial [Mangrovactinospora gilvigrisea]|uniref:ISAs1 family transposase n=1 Tax=Mangrovactinospora gilvigrisea TaxID=1428644 RepID=UPI001FE7775F